MNKLEFFANAKAFVKVEEVQTPAGVLIVQGFTAGERDEFEQYVVMARQKNHTPKDVRARIAIACCIDEEGKKVFSPNDLRALSELPAEVLDPIMNAALRLSGMTEDDVDVAKKNSENNQPDGSSSN